MSAPHSVDPRDRFFGREWLFKAVENWKASGQKTLVLTSPPGVGKTAFSRQIARRWAIDDGLHAVHFCSSASDMTRDATRFVELISAQLSVSNPEFAQAREESVGDFVRADLHVTGTANANFVAPEGWNVGVIVTVPGLTAVEAADKLIRQPLQHLQRASTAHKQISSIILIDALDESQGYESQVSIVRVLQSLATDTGLRWLITSRRDSRVLGSLEPDRTIDLLRDSPVDNDDVHGYVQEIFEVAYDNHKPSTSRLAQRISEKAAGNFLYASIVCAEVLKARPASFEDVELPSDLEGIYERFLRRELLRRSPSRLVNPWLDRYQPILAALAIAFDPGLTLTQLRRALGSAISTSAILEYLADCEHFLICNEPVQSATSTWQIYHSSFREYLVRGEAPLVDVGSAHLSLLDNLSPDGLDGWRDSDPYIIQHAVKHCFEAASGRDLPPAKRRESAERAATIAHNVDYLDEKVHQFGISSAILDIELAQSALSRFVRVDATLIAHTEQLASLLRRCSRVVTKFKPDAVRGLFCQEMLNQSVISGYDNLTNRFQDLSESKGFDIARLSWRAGRDNRLLFRLAGHPRRLVSNTVLGRKRQLRRVKAPGQSPAR